MTQPTSFRDYLRQVHEGTIVEEPLVDIDEVFSSEPTEQEQED